MSVIQLLNNSGVKYEVLHHNPAYTAQKMAAEEKEPGKYVAKPVVVKADGKFVMCVLPAHLKVDFDKLKKQLSVSKVILADESELAEQCKDCETGAEPPFGNLYNMETVMDRTLEEDDHILFQAGSHEEAIKMGLSDYKRLAKPRILEFSYRDS